MNLNVLLYLLYHEHNLVDNHQVFVWILNRWHPPLDFLVILELLVFSFTVILLLYHHAFVHILFHWLIVYLLSPLSKKICCEPMRLACGTQRVKRKLGIRKCKQRQQLETNPEQCHREVGHPT